MIKSAIYLVAICLMLTGCEQSSSPDRQLTLANQGLLSADLASDGKQAIANINAATREAQAAIASPEMTRHVTDIHTVAATLGLQGTPTFFINGRNAAVVQWTALKTKLDALKIALKEVG